ncbi:NAD(P)H-dependent flavin oxidoreductase [Streptomyces sp. NPDC048282]|uniref:NAD(P)H-dependent flavin oxidoreductase n=1 Tax=Streptomyces sp. NPDC048282 TaxID=3365528 RepID=UPI003723B766
MPELPFLARLAVPVLVAPMLRVSGVELVVAACRAGAAAAFPVANAPSTAELDQWLSELSGRLTSDDGPFCPNVIMLHPRLDEQLSVLERHRPEVVITSVGSPRPVVERLGPLGTTVLSDVASLKHAEKAIEAGADGLVLLSAGSGGQTGWANPFAFVRAVRRWFDGPLVLAGGIGDGHALRAAVELGADLGYMGTGFIATHESMAAARYRSMVVDATLDDVVLTRAFTGLPASMLVQSIREAGLDPACLDESVGPEAARRVWSEGGGGVRRWEGVLSAGHSVSAVDQVVSVAELIARVREEFLDGRRGRGSPGRRAPAPG